ncbi:MAG: sulfatase-like hydrolase/transferase [Saprospiraceae bacterium]|nr:sulfatase-like hydrolase/transferase [Saprospiraceae bacterium]
MMTIPYRSFILDLLLFLTTSFLSSCLFTNEDSNDLTEKPNVLLIFTDQQHVDMMSAIGNPYINTPNMDRIAKRGVLFKQSYCTSPVCGPARSSIITGRMPHETGVEWNGDSMKNDLKNVGQLFRQAGYQTIWGGKWHLPESYPQRPKARQKEIVGFDLLPFMAPNPDNWMLGSETDPPLTEAAVKFLSDYKKDQPFFLTVSYHNPHDICFYARKEGWVTEHDSLLNIRHYDFEYQLPDIIGTHPSQYPNLPPLPNNYETDKDEPEFISDKRQYHQEYGLETHLAFNEFNNEEWQGYLNAYHKLTEMVDAEIGKVLDALEANGLEENTIIVFTSDHGDGASAHKWAAKLSLYQEPSTVPLIVSFPQKIAPGQIDNDHLVSQIDIVPTLCDYAGIKTDVTFTGTSLRPILENPEASWRDYLVVELADYKPDQARKGRMVRTANYKFNIYSTGQRNEQLFDLKLDPGETKNLALIPDYQAIRQDHLNFLEKWMSQTNDNFLLPE